MRFILIIVFLIFTLILKSQSKHESGSIIYQELSNLTELNGSIKVDGFDVQSFMKDDLMLTIKFEDFQSWTKNYIKLYGSSDCYSVHGLYTLKNDSNHRVSLISLTSNCDDYLYSEVFLIQYCVDSIQSLFSLSSISDGPSSWDRSYYSLVLNENEFLTVDESVGSVEFYRYSNDSYFLLSESEKKKLLTNLRFEDFFGCTRVKNVNFVFDHRIIEKKLDFFALSTIGLHDLCLTKKVGVNIDSCISRIVLSVETPKNNIVNVLINENYSNGELFSYELILDYRTATRKSISQKSIGAIYLDQKYDYLSTDVTVRCSEIGVIIEIKNARAERIVLE